MRPRAGHAEPHAPVTAKGKQRGDPWGGDSPSCATGPGTLKQLLLTPGLSATAPALRTPPAPWLSTVPRDPARGNVAGRAVTQLGPGICLHLEAPAGPRGRDRCQSARWHHAAAGRVTARAGWRGAKSRAGGSGTSWAGPGTQLGRGTGQQGQHHRAEASGGSWTRHGVQLPRAGRAGCSSPKAAARHTLPAGAGGGAAELGAGGASSPWRWPCPAPPLGEHLLSSDPAPPCLSFPLAPSLPRPKALLAQDPAALAQAPTDGTWGPPNPSRISPGTSRHRRSPSAQAPSPSLQEGAGGAGVSRLLVPTRARGAPFVRSRASARGTRMVVRVVCRRAPG